MGWRGYPDLSFSVCLSAAPLFLSRVHSLYLHLTLSATSLQIVLYLPHLFTVYITMFHSLCAVFFPSALINHNEWEIRHWKPGRARDIYPDLAGQDGEDYKYYICLAVNIFIRGWIITWLRMCLQKHVCLDVPALKCWAVTKITFDRGLTSQLTRRLFSQSLNVSRTRKKKIQYIKYNRVLFLWTQLIAINASVLEQQSIIFNSVFST